MMFALTASFFIIAFGAALVFSIYNALVRLDAETVRAWANIDVILKQRFDEIPQIISVVEQYAGYEKELIERLAKARSHYGQAQTIDDKIQASGSLNVALKGLVALGENYPDLKANQNFLQLQKRVSDLEESLAHRRETFNEAVTIYNTRIRQIPDLLFARALGFKARLLFQVPPAETSAPSLKMKLGS